MKNIITVKLTQLIGLDVEGILAQVTNPIYLKGGSSYDPALDSREKWRRLKAIKTYVASGEKWVEVSWVRGGDDSCNFSGCTVKVDAISIQFKRDDWNALMRVNGNPKQFFSIKI